MSIVFKPTSLTDVLITQLRAHGDDRGIFIETFSGQKYQNAGLDLDFVQDNFASSKQGVLRGLHYQLKKPQAKLITVLQGEILDVAVDIRKGSPTFGKWIGEILNTENHSQLLIPGGFAHGYCVLSETAQIIYKCDQYYDPSDDYGVAWNDKQIGIDWPNRNPILSAKDQALKPLSEISPDLLPTYEIRQSLD